MDLVRRAAVCAWGPRRLVCAALCVLTAFVVFPLLRGHLLLLDWQPASHGPLLLRSARGLDGGVTAGLPVGELLTLLGKLPSRVVGWLPFVVFFPLAGVAAARLAARRADKTRASQLVASVLYAANPFVFDRVAVGQIVFLLGYALLPFAAAGMLRASEASGLGRLAAGGWWAAVAAFSVHFLWIGGVVVLAVLVVRRARRRALLWAAASAASVAALSAYLLFSQLGAERPVTVGASDVAAYATRGDQHYGLFVNVLGLYGFWRQGPQLPKDVVHVWPVLLAAILAIAAVGAWAALRDARRRPLAQVLLLSGTAGYFLALGTQGPTGPLFRFLFDHVPLFQVMREPEKFLCLTALAYAVFFGWGAQRLLEVSRERALKVAVGVLVVALPIAYAPTFVNGLSGQVTGVTVPASFAQADRLMGDGPEQVLFLPWHQYLGFPWTGRVVANPAPALFRRDVIVGDNVELPGVYSTSTSTRSAFLQSRYALGAQQRDFGTEVAHLGVGYVVLAKTLDWQGYAWLGQQDDLRVVLDTPDLSVYEVKGRVDLGARVTADGTLGPAVIRRSAVRYDVPAGPPGTVELAEPYDAAWRLGGAPPTRTARGTMTFPVGAGSTTAFFTHWPVTLAGHLISLTTALALALVLLRDRRRCRRSALGPAGEAAQRQPHTGSEGGPDREPADLAQPPERQF